MKSKIIIIPYSDQNRDAVIAIFKSNIPDSFDETELSDFIEWLDRVENIKRSSPLEIEYYVVLEEETIVGCGGFAFDYDANDGNMIWGLIDQQHHKRGFGKALLSYRINKIYEISPTATITMDTSQYTYPFYQKFGFELIKIMKDGYRKGLDRYDIVLRK